MFLEEETNSHSQSWGTVACFSGAGTEPGAGTIYSTCSAKTMPPLIRCVSNVLCTTKLLRQLKCHWAELFSWQGRWKQMHKCVARFTSEANK